MRETLKTSMPEFSPNLREMNTALVHMEDGLDANNHETVSVNLCCRARECM